MAVVGGGVFAYTRLAGGDPKETVIQAFENVYTEGQTDPMEELFGLSEFAKAGVSASQNSGLMLKLDSCSEPAVNTYAGERTADRCENDVGKTIKSVPIWGIIYNGKEQACRGYEVTVSKEAMINFLRTSSDFFLQDEVLKKDFLKRLELSVKLSQLAGAQMEGQDFPTAQEMQEQTYEEARTEIDGMIAFLDSSLNDVSMTVYVDKEGCLASVKGTTSFNSTGSEAEPVQLQFGCELKGGAYPTQNMSAQAVLENGAASVQIEAVKEGAYDGKELTSGFELSIENQGEIAEKWDITLDSSYNSEGGGFDVQAAAAQDGMELLGFSAQGVVDELEKGKNIHLTLDSLDVSAMGDTGNAVLSGEYYIRPLTEEVVPLEGDTMDVLAAAEEEWNSVLMEVLFSFISLSGQMDTGN